MDLDEGLYRANAPDLVRFAATLVGPSAAEDLVTMAFIKASTSPRWSDVEDQRSYLYRVVMNEARQHHRGDRRRLKREFVATQTRHGPATETSIELALALGDLPAGERAVVFLIYWEGRTVTEASDLLSLPVRSVERRLHHARNRLRKALQ